MFFFWLWFDSFSFHWTHCVVWQSAKEISTLFSIDFPFWIIETIFWNDLQKKKNKQINFRKVIESIRKKTQHTWCIYRFESNQNQNELFFESFILKIFFFNKFTWTIKIAQFWSDGNIQLKMRNENCVLEWKNFTKFQPNWNIGKNTRKIGSLFHILRFWKISLEFFFLCFIEAKSSSLFFMVRR